MKTLAIEISMTRNEIDLDDVFEIYSKEDYIEELLSSDEAEDNEFYGINETRTDVTEIFYGEEKSIYLLDVEEQSEIIVVMNKWG